MLTENFATLAKKVIGRDIEELCYVSQRGTYNITLKLAVKVSASSAGPDILENLANLTLSRSVCC